MKRSVIYIILILGLGIYFSGQILTADAGSGSQLILFAQEEICQTSTDPITGEIYFADGGECSNGLVVTDDNEDRVPTAVKLVYTGTETHDPVSTAGIVLIFFVLVALTVLWIGVIRNWNRTPHI